MGSDIRRAALVQRIAGSIDWEPTCLEGQEQATIVDQVLRAYDTSTAATSVREDADAYEYISNELDKLIPGDEWDGDESECWFLVEWAKPAAAWATAANGGTYPGRWSKPHALAGGLAELAALFDGHAAELQANPPLDSNQRERDDYAAETYRECATRLREVLAGHTDRGEGDAFGEVTAGKAEGREDTEPVGTTGSHLEPNDGPATPAPPFPRPWPILAASLHAGNAYAQLDGVWYPLATVGEAIAPADAASLGLYAAPDEVAQWMAGEPPPRSVQPEEPWTDPVYGRGWTLTGEAAGEQL